MNDPMKKTIINIYRGHFGYGDFIRGTMYLSSLMEERCVLDWSVEKSIRAILKYPGPDMSGIPCIDTKTIIENRSRAERLNFLENLLDTNRPLAVCCNHPEEWERPFTPRIKELFVLLDEYETAFEAFYRDIVGNRVFNVIHCRLGDSFMFTGNGNTLIYSKYPDNIEPLISDTTVLLTDDGEFRDFIVRKYPRLIVTTDRPTHTAKSNDTPSLLSTFFEFRLMTKASRIDCLSSLRWGASGFSRIPAKVFQIPYSHKKVV